MADEFAVPVAALPQVRLRRYSVEFGVDDHGDPVAFADDAKSWVVVTIAQADRPRAALTFALRGEPWTPQGAFSELTAVTRTVEAGVYRVVERDTFGSAQMFLVEVRSVLGVTAYEEPAPESGEASSGDGGS